MIGFERTEAPLFLKNNWKAWTIAYLNGINFSWHNKQKELLNSLKQMSKDHCAFCDDLLFPHSGEIGEVEHLRPKEAFKAFAFAWGNLYPICRRCNNSKNNNYDELLLRPDEHKFNFTDWFRLDPLTFELKPRKLNNPNWKRAEKTIKIYGLNKEDKVVRRQYEITNTNRNSNNIDNLPFRYL